MRKGPCLHVTLLLEVKKHSQTGKRLSGFAKSPSNIEKPIKDSNSERGTCSSVFRGNDGCLSSSWVEASESFLRWQMWGVSWGLPGGCIPAGCPWGMPSSTWGEAFCSRKENKAGVGGWGVGGLGRGREGAAFPFDVTQAESQSAHVNELENAIKNIYILETVIQNLM